MEEAIRDESRAGVLEITPVNPHDGEPDTEDDQGEEVPVDDSYVPI